MCELIEKHEPIADCDCRECACAERDRIRAALECESGTDPVAVVNMLRSWEIDATRRVDILEQHLLSVLEIARTWQPDYATKMDRDTLDMASAEVCLLVARYPSTHLQKLGKRLAELLDEDQWAECEALLLAAGITPKED